jgi:hypothetical protein
MNSVTSRKRRDKFYAELDKCEARLLDSATARRSYAFSVGHWTGGSSEWQPQTSQTFRRLYDVPNVNR